MIGPARNLVRDIDSSLPVAQVRTMDQVLSSAQARPRFLTLLLTMFSGVALVLAAVGIYGVISYSVAQRTGEFGIRMAMGASSFDVLRMVLGQGLLLGVIGVAIGAAGALALTRKIQSLLFGVSAVDPLTFAMMAGGLTLVTLLACWIPARRATRVDPMVALRYE
jgi:putative ABC transport system permease protein